MQKITLTIVSVVMIALGIIFGVLIKFNKVEEGGLLLVAPMIMIGIWLFAYNITRRSNASK
jgi:prolipoprotein diacylglyceryltransferase